MTAGEGWDRHRSPVRAESLSVTDNSYVNSIAGVAFGQHHLISHKIDLELGSGVPA